MKNLKNYVIIESPRNIDFNAGDILKKARYNIELARASQSFGLVNSGILEATQIEGGYGIAVSGLIEFDFGFTNRPCFTWGLDGTIQLEDYGGDAEYSKELPPFLEADALTSSEYQPAIFVPRVVHWWMNGSVYMGCYIMVCQLNPNTTEVDKTVRIHYHFEGNGVKK